MTAFAGLAQRPLVAGVGCGRGWRRGPRRLRHRGPHPIAGPARGDGRLRRRPPGGRGACGWGASPALVVSFRQAPSPVALGSPGRALQHRRRCRRGGRRRGRDWGWPIIVLPALDDLVHDRLRPGAADQGGAGDPGGRPRRLQPAPAGADDERRRCRRRRRGALGRIVLVELAILLVVVGVTAVLVARSPLTSSAAPSDVGDAHAGCRRGAADRRRRDGVRSPSPRHGPGSNEIRVTLTDAAGAADRAGRRTGGRADRGRARASGRCARSSTRSAAASTT